MTFNPMTILMAHDDDDDEWKKFGQNTVITLIDCFFFVALHKCTSSRQIETKSFDIDSKRTHLKFDMAADVYTLSV